MTLKTIARKLAIQFSNEILFKKLLIKFYHANGTLKIKIRDLFHVSRLLTYHRFSIFNEQGHNYTQYFLKSSYFNLIIPLLCLSLFRPYPNIYLQIYLLGI